jgi:hypothetical protein
MFRTGPASSSDLFVPKCATTTSLSGALSGITGCGRGHRDESNTKNQAGNRH